ncbi:MAG TPA: helix-turn-helix transcriptional regulator [Thermoanaerobaculia bacterium]|nr:helix-turn-helix transcriptional regulator [Thermoanaerobaculia bacterium]
MRGGMFAELGRTLRDLREAVGLTQAALARKAGVGKSQLSKYEQGKELPKLETLERLLVALGTDPLTLFYTEHLLRHRAEIFPVTVLMTTTQDLDDPALASFRRLFGHFLDAFEVLVATRSRNGAQTTGSGQESGHGA